MGADKEIFDLIAEEAVRQKEGVELIASENYVSDDVMEAMGSVLTNKYAEGLSGKRYYGGCEVVDKAETLADLDNVDKIRKKDIDRATLLMGINVEYFKNNGNNY